MDKKMAKTEVRPYWLFLYSYREDATILLYLFDDSEKFRHFINEVGNRANEIYSDKRDTDPTLLEEIAEKYGAVKSDCMGRLSGDYVNIWDISKFLDLHHGGVVEVETWDGLR